MVKKVALPIVYEQQVTCDICGKECQANGVMFEPNPDSPFLRTLDFKYHFHLTCLFEFWKLQSLAKKKSK